MPYQWLPDEGDTRHLHLWPHRSLPPTGFVWFIGITVALISLPLLTMLGSPVLWGLLPFIALTVAGIWWALMRSYRDMEILEDVLLTPARMVLTRHGPHGQRREWEANPYWVQVALHPTGGPVPNYLTLKGGPREVEIGAFLSEEERVLLAQDLSTSLGDLKRHGLHI